MSLLKRLRQGVPDMVRTSDARIGGGSTDNHTLDGAVVRRPAN